MGTITLSDYLASRPSASTPLGAEDKLLVMQGGAVKHVASDDVGAALVAPIIINTAVAANTVLPADGEVLYLKLNDGGPVATFSASVVGQTLCQELQNGITGEREYIRVRLVGTTWYRVG